MGKAHILKKVIMKSLTYCINLFGSEKCVSPVEDSQNAALPDGDQEVNNPTCDHNNGNANSSSSNSNNKEKSSSNNKTEESDLHER